MKYYLAVWQKYAVFEGRARRMEYWTFVLINVIISIVLSLLDATLETGLLSPIYSLATIIPSIAVGVRRMHDVGKSGWYLLIPIYSLILAFTEGDVDANEYGPNPKMTEAEVR